jgi:hypothetical protein
MYEATIKAHGVLEQLLDMFHNAFSFVKGVPEQKPQGFGNWALTVASQLWQP